MYTILLFTHLVGVIAVFVGVGVWLFVVIALWRAREVAQARALAGLTTAAGNLAVAGLLPLAVGGLAMAYTTWGPATWIIVATVSFILLAPFGVFVIDPRIRAVGKAAAAAPDGSLPAALAARIHDPLLGGGLCLYIAVLVGIVYVMTMQPTLAASILAMIVALALGFACALPFWWFSRSTKGAQRASVG